VPVFAHIPLVLDEKGAKLSKRDKTASVNFYKNEGYLPEALINYMALIGWNPGRKNEVLTREEIISTFDIKKVTDSNARFDIAKLNYFNRAHMRQIEPERYIELAKPFLERAGLSLPSIQVALVARESSNLLKDAPTAILPYVCDNFPIGLECNEYLSKEQVPAICSEVIKLCKTGASVKSAIDQAGELLKVKGKDLHFPIRALLIGSTSGPAIERIAEAIGMEKFYQRLERK